MPLRCRGYDPCGMPYKVARLRKRGTDSVEGSTPSPLNGLTQWLEYVFWQAKRIAEVQILNFKERPVTSYYEWLKLKISRERSAATLFMQRAVCPAAKGISPCLTYPIMTPAGVLRRIELHRA